jgi:hypothetical protein
MDATNSQLNELVALHAPTENKRKSTDDDDE